MPGFDVIDLPSEGKRVRLSQSFIGSWRNCNRSAVADALSPSFGQAAAEGILAHAIMAGRIERGGVYTELDREDFHEAWEELATAGFAAEPGLLDAVLIKADSLTEVYADKCLDLLDQQVEFGGSVTWGFDRFPDQFKRRAERLGLEEIEFSGTVDLLGRTPTGQQVAYDWKTGARMPDPWVVQRYSPQWRGYAILFSLDRMYFEYPIAFKEGKYPADRYKGVIACQATPEERAQFEIQMIHECVPIALALTASQDPELHAISPTGWHCSAKWCQEFANHKCIGATEVAWITRSHTENIKGEMK